MFVDGCFWHGCPAHYTEPGTHADYWGPKVAGNVERDRDTDRRLREAGWRVVRAWEHETAQVALDRVLAALRPPIANDPGESA